MKYGEPLDGGASGCVLRECLSGGETTANGFRDPGNPKSAAAEDAGNCGMGFSAFVRTSMMEELARRRS